MYAGGKTKKIEIVNTIQIVAVAEETEIIPSPVPDPSSQAGPSVSPVMFDPET